MMKRKVLYLWGLLLLFLGIINSCRNDFLQEHQANQEIRNQGLNHKIISLNQSKHYNRLAFQINKAKIEFNKASFKNALGKNVNYGDSITINTDHVIYIENGNYHTYTFNIQRTNSSPNDPVENLLLSQLPDGTYREFLVTYNLTQQERENISNGRYFYSGNNTSVVELVNGTFNGTGQLAKTSCGWQTRTGWNRCSSEEHDGSNFMDCDYLYDMTNGYPPTTYTYSVYICEQDATIAPTDPPGSGGGGGGGGGTPCEDCPPTEPTECTQVPNDPQSPSTIVDENGCAIGTPTLPNLPIRNNPCKAIKDLFANEKFKAKYDTLTKPELFNQMQEKAFVMKHPPIGTTGVEPAFIPIDMPPCSTGDNDAVWPSNQDGITIIMHDHTNEDCNGNTPIKAPSPVDIKTFINKLLGQANTFTGSYLGAASLVTTSQGNYMLMYDGTNYPGSINASQLEQLDKDYVRDFQDLYDRNDNVTQADIERLFTKFLKEKINKPGLNVYRVTATTAKKLEYDPTAPNSVKETNCP